MQEAKLSQKEMMDLVMDVFDQQLPFNRFLGLNVHRDNFEKATITLNWQDNLMGNPYQKILHGGVTAAILDTVGGLMAMLYVAKDLDNLTAPEFHHRVGRIGTIDMRVDYLRPGKGEQFTATAEMIRKGNKVAVCRMELHNEQQTHIAFGTATYML